MFLPQILAKKVYTLYSLAVQQLSRQDHYDFGLRALTSLLRYAGKKRRLQPDLSDEEVDRGPSPWALPSTVTGPLVPPPKLCRSLPQIKTPPPFCLSPHVACHTADDSQVCALFSPLQREGLVGA